ncbi:MAG: uracil-DNA glycosylase [Chthoniobacterales bacterium]
MDRFHSAVSTTLPLLEELRNGLIPAPGASRAALHRLKVVAHELAVANPPTKTSDQTPPGASNLEPPGSTSPALIPTRSWSLPGLQAAAIGCTECPHLVSSRTQVVFGVGNPDAELMFVGEAPGADEDVQGEPFVGKAGQLLTKIIQTMGFARGDVYIANVLKCRPDMPPGTSGNRKPKPEEMATCFPWLAEQIRLVRPKVLVALGATAVEGLLGEKRPMRDLRGKWLEYEGVPVLATYHPAYLLRNQATTEKRKVWEDMLLVLKKLERPISAKQDRFFT